MNWKYFLISTVERDICRGVSDMGPPKNGHHVREWNKLEFMDFCNR